MQITHLLAFNLALLAAIASPGPALLVAIKTSLTAGRRAGIAIGLGLGLMAALWTLAALIGLEALFVLFPWAFTLVKTIGAIYLLYVAFGMWRHARAPLAPQNKPSAHAFRQGLLINALNPKAVLFAAAVLVVVFPKNMSLAESLIIVTNHLLVEWLFYLALAYAMSSRAVSQRYLRAKPYMDRSAAVVLGGLGLKLLR